LRAIERNLRRKGYLETEERFVDWYAGSFVALYECGTLSPARPQTRLPWSQPWVIAAYTDRLLLFMGRRFVRSCAIQGAVRVDVYKSRMRFLFSAECTGALSMLEIKPTGHRTDDFIEKLLLRRDLVAAGAPNFEAHIETTRKLRSVPASKVLEAVVLDPCGGGGAGRCWAEDD
jgi:hypothetical protein